MWCGVVIMVGTEAATLAHIEPFWSWNTPIAWTGFILFADSLVYLARGDSWIRSAPAEFAALALLSIPLWLVFEFYNQFIDNWYYVGLPVNFWLRTFGYAWSFATIWPAIFEAAELIAVWHGGDGRRYVTDPETVGNQSRGLSSGFLIAIGFVMLASPFVVSPAVARYLAAPVWLGFIFLLDPINQRLRQPSLLDDLGHRDLRRFVNLAASGMLCGFLWEFWNYWSRSKWHYTVPIMERFKVFEMPLPGFFGFPAFAFECFTMYVFVRSIWTVILRDDRLGVPRTRGRSIAL